MNTIKLCNPKTYAQSGYRPTKRTGKSARARKNKASAPQVRRQSHALVYTCLLLTIVFALAFWGTEQVRARRTYLALSLVPSTQITVGTGDSLWTIAQAHSIDGVSTSELIDWLKDENDLSGSVLALGQSLTVPDVSQQALTNA